MESILLASKKTKINKTIAVIAILISICEFSIFAQISGTKTIGTGGDYSTFTAAVSALNTQGVNGPVVFNVISGTYSEQFTINNVTGASATNNIIFQSQAGDSTAVILQWTATGTADNYVLTIDGGRFMAFRGMTFKAMSTSYGKLVEIKGMASDITFSNNLFLGLEANDGTPTKTIINGEDKNLENIIIKNSRFINGSQAIFFQGYNDKFITGIKITGNIMINSGLAGVRTNWVFAPEVTGNDITAKQNGIYIRSGRGNGNYSRNKIKSDYTGMDIQHNETYPQKTMITNNFITVASPNQATGITIPNTIMAEIYNNSVYIKSKYPASAAFQAGSGSATAGVVIKNNNFVCANKGYALDITTPVAISEMSNNNLYTEGNFIAKWGADEIADLRNLQSVSGMNENSLAVYPHYVSITDLHTTAPWLDGKGTSLPGITDDIDGDPRDPSYPDIGADEFASDPGFMNKLSGTYTIGTNGYYPDFAAALNDALLRGVSGPVVFSIKSGTYNEQIKIRNIPGSSSVNTVTFQSETGNYNDVKISWAATAETPNYVIGLLGADFIQIRNLSVAATGALYSRVFNLSQGCDSIVFENNYLEGRAVTDGTDKAYIINSDSCYFRSRIIKGNIFKNGSIGLYMRRDTYNEPYCSGAVIEDNNITGTGHTGIYVQFHDKPLINRNIISAKSRGIYMITCTGPAVISANKVSSVAGEGIFISGCKAPANNRGLIVNNFVQAGGYSDTKGLVLSGAEYYSVLYNSVNITGVALVAKAFEITPGTTGIIIKNNIFSNKSAYTISVTSSASVAESDYNDFYSTGPGPFAYWGGAGFADLASLTAASGKDLHSISADPLFVSDTDLHTTASQLDGKATPVTEVRNDIDGRRRDVVYPDLGASEFGPIANYYPDAKNDTVASTTSETIIINALSNDSDPDGDKIKISAVRSPEHGSVALNPSGLEFSYISAAGFVGQDSCKYVISDDYGLKDSAWVFFDVEPLPLFSLTDIDIIDLSHSSVAWGDYDDDGDLDVLITGWLGTSSNYASRIYRNENGKFSDSGIVLRGLSAGTSHSAEWMDLDNDNDLDVIITGSITSNPLEAKTIIYENLGGKFTESDQPDLIQSTGGSVDWSDFDRDGMNDLLITGEPGGTAETFNRIFKNSGPDINGDWLLKPYAAFEGIWSGESMWVDFDKDGDPDIFSCGFGADPSKLYQNKDGIFTSVLTNLPSVGNAACDWADYDNDGDKDLALCGRSGTNYYTKILRNDGLIGKAYTFTDIGASLVQVCSGDIAWGDFDNDGDPDLVYTGNTGTLTSVTKLYENVKGVFTEKSTPFRDIGRSTLAWGDYDGDKDLDLIIAGFSPSLNRPFTGVYRNNHNLPGDLPLAPVNLISVSQGDQGVLLSWEPADVGIGKTTGPLTYNLRIGTDQGTYDIVSPLADINKGLRKVAGNGNTELSESYLISGLKGGRKYYWSVQSVDMAFRGSPFSEEKSFYVQYDNSLSGQIWDRAGTLPINKATVILIPESNINDTTQLKLNITNSYMFSDLPSGRYTILAIPDPVEYDESIPTYLGTVKFLHVATWVQVTGNITAPDLRLLNAPPANTGSYLISGNLIIDYSGAKGISVSEKGSDTKGGPVAGASVFLEGATDGLLKAWDVTGSDGSFEFPSLPEGSYLFSADCQGKPMHPSNPVLPLSDARKTIEILAKAGIDKIIVTDISTGTERVELTGIKVYPVPVRDNLFIEIPEGIFSNNTVYLRIFDISGKPVFVDQNVDATRSTLTISIDKLKAGIYLIYLSDTKMNYKVKIVKTN